MSVNIRYLALQEVSFLPEKESTEGIGGDCVLKHTCVLITLSPC